MGEPESRPDLSVVVPVYDEEAVLEALHRRVVAALAEVAPSFELLFVDDGSRDDTAAALARIHAADPRVVVVRLSRNFGHQAALLAGLDHARGRAVITMDGDLQHPPELLPALVQRWREGYHIVYTVRREDQASGLFKRWSRRMFYRLFRLLSHVDLEADAADFRLLDARVVVALRRFRERYVFLRGLVSWVGFRTVPVPYTAPPRLAGRSKYTVRRMGRLAIDGLFSFTTLPLRIAIWAGLAVAVAGVAYGAYALYAAVVLHATVPGWTSLMIVLLVVGGMQLLMLGIVGEYLGRVYEETKQRPLYLVQEVLGHPGDPPLT